MLGPDGQQQTSTCLGDWCEKGHLLTTLRSNLSALRDMTAMFLLRSAVFGGVYVICLLKAQRYKERYNRVWGHLASDCFLM